MSSGKELQPIEKAKSSNRRDRTKGKGEGSDWLRVRVRVRVKRVRVRVELGLESGLERVRVKRVRVTYLQISQFDHFCTRKNGLSDLLAAVTLRRNARSTRKMNRNSRQVSASHSQSLVATAFSREERETFSEGHFFERFLACSSL